MATDIDDVDDIEDTPERWAAKEAAIACLDVAEPVEEEPPTEAPFVVTRSTGASPSSPTPYAASATSACSTARPESARPCPPAGTPAET